MPFRSWLHAPVIKEIAIMSAELDRLTASVAASTAATEALITLTGSIAAQIRNAVVDGDGSALMALADTIDAETAKVNAALAADATPAPTPAPAPVTIAPAVPIDVAPADAAVPTA